MDKDFEALARSQLTNLEWEESEIRRKKAALKMYLGEPIDDAAPIQGAASVVPSILFRKPRKQHPGRKTLVVHPDGYIESQNPESQYLVDLLAEGEILSNAQMGEMAYSDGIFQDKAAPARSVNATLNGVAQSGILLKPGKGLWQMRPEIAEAHRKARAAKIAANFGPVDQPKKEKVTWMDPPDAGSQGGAP